MTVTRSIGLILTTLLLAVAATGTAEQSAPSVEIIGIGDSMDWLIFLMAWSVPGYFLLQGWVWLRWHNGWRKAGLLPLWAGVPATGHAVFALLMGSNLWPLVMLFVLPVLSLYLSCLFVARLYSRNQG